MSATTPTTVFHGMFAPGSRPYFSRLPIGSCPGQNRLHHLLVDHHDRLRSLSEVALLQQPAAEEWNAHRLEIAGHDLVFGQRRRRLVWPPRRLTLERDPIVRLTVNEEVADCPDGEDARQRSNAARGLGIESGPLLAGVIGSGRGTARVCRRQRRPPACRGGERRRGVDGSRHDVDAFRFVASHVFAAGAPDGSIMAADHQRHISIDDGGMKWIEQSIGLSEFDVRAIAVLDSGELVAATLHDVCMSSDNGKNWHLSKAGLVRRRARPSCLLAEAACRRRHRSRRLRVRYCVRGMETSPSAPSRPVLSLAWDGDQRLWVGTAAHGLNILRHRPDKWLASSGGLLGHEVLAIAIGPQRSILATTSRGTFRAALP